tara:strand:+ start:610 stop:966 length:357 start_codon:yes stop_codon:yes gene_type:complete
MMETDVDIERRVYLGSEVIDIANLCFNLAGSFSTLQRISRNPEIYLEGYLKKKSLENNFNGGASSFSLIRREYYGSLVDSVRIYLENAEPYIHIEKINFWTKEIRKKLSQINLKLSKL